MRWSSDRGQALVEFALGLPLLLAATIYAFAVVDAAATHAAVTASAGRAAIVLAGTNSDQQTLGAARSGPTWLAGQDVGFAVDPPERAVRCAKSRATITVSAPGHLGFLLPVGRYWTHSERVTIENEGAARDACRSR